MLPCEKMTKYYIPAIRVNITKNLYRLGRTQTQIAHLLGITQAAVNKYLSGNYSSEIKRMENDAEVVSVSKQMFEKIKLEELNETGLNKLMVESCSVLSGCGVKHD